MTNYSNSRISAFEQCPYKYKLQYIEKIRIPREPTIEIFLGNMIHETLEKLYKDLRLRITNSKEELITFYEKKWNEKYTNNILIVKKNKTKEDYFELGRKMIIDYYDSFFPFEDTQILGLETNDFLELSDENKWYIRIDKLEKKDNTIYISDYKTSSSLKTQEEADNDRQLAMYLLWARKKYPNIKEIKLRWYMLAFNKIVESTRNQEELSAIEKRVVDKIKEIENCKEFPTNISPLCKYCLYQDFCPDYS
jgi:putative RecB family exonuclease